MKRSELRHIIQEVIREQTELPSPTEAMPFLTSPSTGIAATGIPTKECESIQALKKYMVGWPSVDMGSEQYQAYKKALTLNGCMETSTPWVPSDNGFTTPQPTGVEHDCPGCPQQE